MTAFLVVFLDEADVFVAYGVFSEPPLTYAVGLRPVVIVSFHGRNYREASAELRAWVRQNHSVLVRTPSAWGPDVLEVVPRD
jgi:hypothetical protein